MFLIKLFYLIFFLNLIHCFDRGEQIQTEVHLMTIGLQAMLQCLMVTSALLQRPIGISTIDHLLTLYQKMKGVFKFLFIKTFIFKSTQIFFYLFLILLFYFCRLSANVMPGQSRSARKNVQSRSRHRATPAKVIRIFFIAYM